MQYLKQAVAKVGEAGAALDHHAHETVKAHHPHHHHKAAAAAPTSASTSGVTR